MILPITKIVAQEKICRIITKKMSKVNINCIYGFSHTFPGIIQNDFCKKSKKNYI